MEADVDEMVGKCRITPDAMLNPEGRMRDGVVLLRCAEVEPDARQAMKGLQFRAGDVLVVVPQQPAAPHRLIRGERGKEKRQSN